MHPETQLAVLAALVGYLLRTSLGFCICWLIAKAVSQPRHKFLVWFGYLIFAATYWLWMLASLAPHGVPSIPAQVRASLPASPAIHTLQLQSLWVSPISIVLLGLASLYAVALASLLYLRAKKHLHLRWILRFTYAAPEATQKIFDDIAKNLQVRNARLLMLSGIYSPATFGWVKPIVLLPPLCLEQDESELLDVLRHELQHVRRRDSLFSTLATVCRALLCFHPAAWHAMNRLRLESELACDLAVVGSSPERRASYAECLLRFARMRVAQEATPWNLDFAGSPVQLKVRIGSMLAGSRSIPGWILGLRAAFGLLLLSAFAAASPSLSIAFSYQQPSPDQLSSPAKVTAGPQPSRIRTGSVRKSLTRAARAVPVKEVPSAEPQPGNPLQTAMDAPVAPLTPKKSFGSDPALKHRGDPTSPKAPANSKIILLSNPSSADSAHSLAGGASVASAISAGAKAALDVASHGRAKDTH